MTELATLLSSVGSIAGVFIVTMAFVLLMYRQNRQSRYDEERHRVELEKMREMLERRIYDVTDKLVATEDRWRDINHLLISRLNTQPESASASREPQLSDFLRSHGLTKKDLQIDPSFVFVLVPFNKEFEHVFGQISSTCQKLGLRCARGDEQEIRGDLLPHILRMIAKARIVIAVIDGRNPNVFYELGIAHALGKVTVLVTKSYQSAPIDLRAKKLVIYHSDESLREFLALELTRSVLQSSDTAQG